ncbi:MAG: glycosyltransferase family 4 protein [Bryobacteraceae bacterium]
MVVVVHRSARDKYQVAQSLEEAGILECLVTDFYWPKQAWWAYLTSQLTPARISSMLLSRQNSAVHHGKTRLCAWSGLTSVGLNRLSKVPFSWRAKSIRWSDHCLGRRAGKIASRTNSTLLSYSYYGYDSFSAASPSVPKILFQLHPHPVSVRSILKGELERYPECAGSLNKEWELALPEEDFARLTAEPLMAQRWMAASSFTRTTLIDQGIDGKKIHVIPYGIDAAELTRGAAVCPRKSFSRPLEVLFVGRLTQRKGIRYLLEALDRLHSNFIHLTLCGWSVDDLALLKRYKDRITLKTSATAEQIGRAYQEADIFVLPSVAEGFGYVLLEAMAFGLPIVGTTRTAAPDLIRDGEEGLVIEPASVEAIAASLDWAASNREAVRAMGDAARQRVQQFTWRRFRNSVASSVKALTCEILAERSSQGATQHV